MLLSLNNYKSFEVIFWLIRTLSPFPSGNSSEMGSSCMWCSWDICFHTWWPVSDIAPDIRLTQWHCSRPRSSGCSRARSPECISLESLWTQELSCSGYSCVVRSRPLSTRIRWSHQSRTFCGVAYCSSDWGWACKFFGVRRTCGLLEGIFSLQKDYFK